MKALCVSLRGGGAELAPFISGRLSPGDQADGNGLSLGASCGLGLGRGPSVEAEWRSGTEEVRFLLHVQRESNSK